MKLLHVVAATMVWAAVCFAQIDTGSIVGSVRDPSGAEIPNATLSATNKATKASMNSRAIPALPLDYCIGEYAVGRRICAVNRRTSGPFFSVSANLAARSESDKKAAHFFSRSARLS